MQTTKETNNNDDDTSLQSSSSTSISITNKEVTSLVNKMISLGYFHHPKSCDGDDHDDNQADDYGNDDNDDHDKYDATIESMRKFQSEIKNKNTFHTDLNCDILLPQPQQQQQEQQQQIFCMTKSYLEKLLYSKVEKEGHIKLSTICNTINLPLEDIQYAAKNIISSNSNSKPKGDNEVVIYMVKKELFTNWYLYKSLESMIVPKLKKEGSMLISELASCTYMNLPVDFILEVIENVLKRQHHNNHEQSEKNDHDIDVSLGWIKQLGVKLILSKDGAKILVTNNYEMLKGEEVKKLLLDVREPIKLHDLTLNIDWDSHHILEHIQLLCENQELDGEIHLDSSSSSSAAGAIYIPNSYKKNQTDFIESYYQINGYVTVEQAAKAGISIKRLEKCILNIQNHQAIILQNCIVHSDIIIAPIQDIIEECLQMSSFADLSLHVPADLLCYKEDLSTIMNKYSLKNSTLDTVAYLQEELQSGCFIITNDEVLFFSSGMIAHMNAEILPPLIEDFAKTRALEIADTLENNNSHSHHKKKNLDNESNKDKTNKQRVGRSAKAAKIKSKRSKKKSLDDNNADCHSHGAPKADLVPLATVARSISEHYPDLIDIQESHGGIADADDSSIQLKWNTLENEEENFGGPLYEFCRVALNNAQFEKNCSNAVDAELEKIIKTRKGASMTSNAHGAKSRNIEDLFHESYPSSCYFVQIAAKYYTTVISDLESNSEVTNAITNDVLKVCALFAQRLTEYCIFKHALDEENIFVFSNDQIYTDTSGNGESKEFYLPIDTTRLHFPSVFLSCSLDDSGASQDPLQLL